jgi:membrane protease YdiL (CAAX protease family)
MTNFLITSVLMALLAAFMEEMVFRGVIFNLWRTSFATQAEALSNSQSAVGRAAHKFFDICGSSIAVVIAAALFALAHLNMEAFLQSVLLRTSGRGPVSDYQNSLDASATACGDQLNFADSNFGWWIDWQYEQ